MIKLILIAGTFVNLNYVTSLTPERNGCLVTVQSASRGGYSGVWYGHDERSCEEIIKKIGRVG
jgi:hypothetical protein